MVKNQMEERIKVHHMDNGSEFFNKEFKFFCEVNGIMKQFVMLSILENKMALSREKIEHWSKVFGLDVEPCKFI